MKPIKRLLQKIAKNDWQYLIILLVCSISYIGTDVLRVLNKTKFAYWSGRIINEPYRIIASHFVHGDIEHLAANAFGIVIARYCLKSLNLKGNYFFLLLISLIIPLQTILLWFIDIFLFNNPKSIAVGFSGVLYGINAFSLLSSTYGKKYFIGLEVGLTRNIQTQQILITLTVIGIIFSFLPGTSMLGHLTGLVAGIILFGL